MILIIAVELIVSSWAITSNINVDQRLVTVSWACFISFILEIILWKRLSGEWLSPYTVFFAVLFVFSCGQSIGWSLNIDLGGQDLWNRVDFGMSRVNITQAMCYSMLAVSFFHLGAILFYRDIKKVHKWSEDEVVATFKLVAKPLLILCIPSFSINLLQTVLAVVSGGYAAYYSVMESRSQFFTLMGYIGDYYQPCLLLLLIAYREKKSYRNLIIFMMLIEVVCQLYIGGRSGAVMTVLGIFLAIHYFVKPFKGKSAIAVGVAGYGGLVILNTILEIRNMVDKSVAGFLGSFISSLSNPIGHFVGELGWSMSSTVWTMMLVPDIYPYRYGISYMASLLAPIPNLGFWKVHPAKIYANVGDWLEEVLNYGHGIGYSMVAESYLNFGWFGFFAMLIFGAVLVRLLANVKREDVSNNMVGAAFQILIIMTIMKSLVRASFSISMRSIVYVLIPLYFFIINSLKKRRN